MSNPVTVHIVDDEPNIRLMFRAALEAAGYQTLESGDGHSALAQLSECLHDVMLLDLRMPGMDAMETLWRMRERGTIRSW
jgi:two-component system KDP operon response regulator KdpE